MEQGMGKRFAAVFILAALPFTSNAGGPADQARSFAEIYTSLCMKHLTNLDALREKLKQVPKLAPEQARHFLSGRSGDAWSVPDKHGTFVLALPHQKNLCAVYARRADTRAAEKLFVERVGTAPAPLIGKRTADDHARTASGPTHTLAYEWGVPKAGKKMVFTLTTAASDTAQVQVLGTAAIANADRAPD
ncbi:NMCC_0638 family (lipo)protein [Massilia sp. BHUDP2]|uniref:NMCC_0638 family (lipo)protein n=1 Tax=Massilia sp. BHUDP2 TaxID=3034505 RepID=UPI001AE6D4EC